MTLNLVEIEVVSTNRWLIRDAKGSRLGEVFGGKGQYQSQTMKGDLVTNNSTLSKAAQSLLKK